MKNTAITAAIFFFFFSFTNAQNVGDRKKQNEVFGNQPTWKSLTEEDTYKAMVVSDYFACKTGTALFWNAITGKEAEVQAFMPDDSILIATHDGEDFIYKNGCKNRLKYIRCVAPGKNPASQPAPGNFGQRPEPEPTPRATVKKLTFEVSYKNGDVESVYTIFDRETCELVRTEIVYYEMINGILLPVTYEEWMRWVCCHTQTDIVGLPYRNSGCPRNR